MQLFLTLAIGGASVYFFYQGDFVLALLLLIWTMSRLLEPSFKKISSDVANSKIERNSNIAIELKINVAEVLKHEVVSQLYEKIKHEKKIVKFGSKEKWIDILIENYKEKYDCKVDYITKESNKFPNVRCIWDIVKFNIKNNILYKNGELDFDDSIYHEIFIPYEYISAKDEEERFGHRIDSDGIKIRVFVVNGFIKLQVGNFDKATTPKFIREEGLAVYLTYFTVTSFPLIYIDQTTPVNYLNLSMYATDSYCDSLLSGKGGDWARDWKEINKEIREYSYIKNRFADDNPTGDGRLTKYYQKFHKKGLELLVKENFIDPNKREESEWYVPGWMQDKNIHYLNKFLYIGIIDYKNVKENMEQYYWTDYYEEIP